MGNQIRTIVRGSVLLLEKFSPQIKKAKQLADSRECGCKNKSRIESLPNIYPSQGELFDCSPTKNEKDYKHIQSTPNPKSWYPESLRKNGKNYKVYSDGTVHEILITGQYVKAGRGVAS